MPNQITLILLIFCFMVLSVFSFIKITYNSKYGKIICFSVYYFTAFVIFLCIIFRTNAWPDYDAYVRMFNIFVNDLSRFRTYSVEKSFGDISSLVITFFHSDVFFLFLIYTLIGFSIKVNLFLKISDYPIVTLLIYFSFFCFLHDFIQIRIACAITFFIISIYFRSKDKNILCILFLCISVYFHLSAITGFIILLLKNNKINIYLYIFALFISYLLAIIKVNVIDLVKYIPIKILQSKVSVYSISRYQLNDIINLAKLVRLIFLLIIIKNINRLSSEKINILFVKLFFASIIVQQVFIAIPVFPTRISEYFRITEVFILPKLCNYFREKTIYHLLLIIYCLYLFLFSLRNYFL